MTPVSAMRIGKRRRVLVVGTFILMAGAAYAWLLLNRRHELIGTWSTRDTGQTQRSMTFYSNGIVEVGTHRYRWWTADGRIYRRQLSSKRGPLARVGDFVQEIWERATGDWNRLAFAGSNYSWTSADQIIIN